jgi:hypothetical protein
MIVCPHCHQPFELDEALESTFRAHMNEEMEKQLAIRLEKQLSLEKKKLAEQAAEEERNKLSVELTRLKEMNALKEVEMQRLVKEQEQLKAEAERREREIRLTVEKTLAEALALEQTRLKREFEEKNQMLLAQQEAAAKKLKAYAEREAELLLREQSLEAEIQQKLQVRLAEEKLKEEARLKAEQERIRKELAEQFLTDLERLKQEKEEKDLRLKALRERELELEAEKRRLQHAFEEEQHRKRLQFEEEKAQLERQLREKLEAEMRLQLQAKEAQIEAMRKNAEELQKKARQGLARHQGEAQEEFLKRKMLEHFPGDRIEDIKSGKLGADLKWFIYDEQRMAAGFVLIESKNAENFSNNWIEKLKQDREREGADLAVLVTQAFPAGMEHFGQREGVWICAPHELVPMLEVLRVALIDIAKTRASLKGFETKAGLLYEYLTSAEFAQRVSLVLDTFRQLREQLEKERTAFERQWAERERLLTIGNRSLAAAFGQIGGIAGADLPGVSQLQLGD